MGLDQKSVLVSLLLSCSLLYSSGLPLRNPVSVAAGGLQGWKAPLQVVSFTVAARSESACSRLGEVTVLNLCVKGFNTDVPFRVKQALF